MACLSGPPKTKRKSCRARGAPAKPSALTLLWLYPLARENDGCCSLSLSRWNGFLA
ncbi:uncharacterized protein LY79DRAFT_560091 [Colletotrichum navitas]|uniref:Uncharacterized protein n=1 Tax=Colletotrichum navitas TaxID=681940 RepID=A0AAD8PUC5_9PEZI|nr:uncharacterized protein LY79DRAFT_560091 [Colletotrichum navitas]KAK1584824.1 hypothetical protein LY79DRAFT_560091 [Colletotrichum navitas]